MTGKKKLCSRFLVIIPDFWAPFLTFLGTFAFKLDTLLAHSGGVSECYKYKVEKVTAS